MAMSKRMQAVYAVAEEYDKTLRADDPRFGRCVYLIDEEGTALFYRSAFVLLYREAEREWFLVFTEHQGFHVFAADEVNRCWQFCETGIEKFVG